MTFPARFLVRRRKLLFLVMTLLTAACVVLIPRINVNSDLTRYLPDSSPMKQGIDRMAEDFPDMDTRMRTLDVMFTQPVDVKETEAELNAMAVGYTPLGVQEAPPYTLFQYRVTGDTDPFLLKKDILSRYGDLVVVDIAGDEKMPPNLPSILLLGTALVFIILLVMCSSVMEVLLFLITTGYAVGINMGTNALLDSVSMITNSLVAVLQLVLSMDYSIIVMNRYRQEKARLKDNETAMADALTGAAPAVLSSALTTIVSLLMLVFIRFKIGADLGIVLSKGVFCSLVCNFLVLPALILWFDKAIVKTQKKVPSLPALSMSRFEMKFRIPLTVLFVVLFVGSFLLQKRTVISFSAFWPTEISTRFPPQNPMMLLYATEDEETVLPLLDTLAADPLVASCYSYPGLALKQYTAPELVAQFSTMTPLVTEDLLQIVYYARSHPQRTERFTFEELMDVASGLADQGLVPEGFDVSALTEQLTRQLTEATEEPEEPQKPEEPEIQEEAEKGDPAETPAAPDSTAEIVPVVDTAAVEVPAPETDTVVQTGRFTYEEATRQLTAREMAAFLGTGRSQVSALYRMAGKGGGTMSPHEFTRYVNSRILPDKRYSAFISDEQSEALRVALRQLDSAVAAGPPRPLELPADTLAVAQILAPLPEAVDTLDIQPEPLPEPVQELEPKPEPEPLTPLERLAEMAFSGERYTAAQVAAALRPVGIPVSRSDLELLYLYAGSRQNPDPDQTMSVCELVNYLTDTLLVNPAFSRFIDAESRNALLQAQSMLTDGAGLLRSPRSSIAALVTDYERESDRTFGFIDHFRSMADTRLPGDHFLIGESVMFKELKDSFPSELLLLTLLTVASIFLIVAVTFRSVLIPAMLIMTVLSGVYINVFVSGLGGNTLFFLAYLIVQSILMGATIDYSILLTNYYRDSRHAGDAIPEALTKAYRGAGHTILTSGLIIVLTPTLMFLLIDDPMIAMILKSLAVGALSAILIILLVLPAVLAVGDRLVTKKKV